MNPPPHVHVAVYIAFGPEVRAFLHSGLIEELGQKCHVSVITERPDARAFRGIGANLIEAPAANEPRQLRRIRNLGAAVREAYLRRNGGSRWRHYLSDGTSSRRGAGASLAHWFGRTRRGLLAVAHVEGLAGGLWGTNPRWAELFRTHEVDAFLMSAYSHERVDAASQTARNLGIRYLVAPNSFKDVFVKPGLTVRPDVLFVWNEELRQMYLKMNPRLASHQIKTAGSLHIHAIRQGPHLRNRREFCVVAGLDPERPIVCYTTAAPNAVEEEHVIVRALAEAVATGQIGGRPQLLVRVNPMEEGNRFEATLEGLGGVRVQRPVWEWDRPADWCCALRDDVDLWRDTVSHSSVNVSIASTVTLEFLAAGKPVVNVCFDAQEVDPGSSNRRFWDASHYEPCRQARGVRGAFSYDEMLGATGLALNGEWEDLAPPSWTELNPVKLISDAVIQGGGVSR